LSGQTVKANRIAGLDTIRAISALWVVMGHIGAPPLTAGLDESNGLARVVVGIYANFWSGPAAVMVFFVISGFCIHYPYARSLTVPSQKAYLVRRYCRIAVPLVIAVGISRMLSVNLSLFNLSILWSLVAELVYYTIYPLLLHARRATGSWMPLVICAFGLALALAATQPSAGNYPSFGNALNWLLGLPVWLSGCWLADRVVASKGPTAVSFGQIWVWRGAILVLATVCSILRSRLSG